MGKVLFYQLIQSSAEETARVLLGRALQMGWHVMIRSADQAALQRLDARLWQPEDSFLPHGLEGGAHDGDQPVLLGQGAAVNGAKGVILLGETPVDLTEAAGLERVWLLFDGMEGSPELVAARQQWKAVTAAGLVAEYWAEVDGRWQMKASSGGDQG